MLRVEHRAEFLRRWVGAAAGWCSGFWQARRVDPEQSGQQPGRLHDCLFLTLLMLLSFALYLPRLGFYSDQWLWFAQLSLSPDQSLGALFQTLDTPQTRMRPLESLYTAALYGLFGLDPLGSHLANGAMLLLLVVLFYLVLRDLGQPRVLAIAIPAVYGLLPHYSTARFWSFATNPSVTLYFLSLYADLRVLRAAPRYHAAAWGALSLVSLVGSALLKEMVLPLFLLNPLLVWYRARALAGQGPRGHATPASLPRLFLSRLLVLGAVVAFKAATTTRLGEANHLVRSQGLLEGALALNRDPYEGGLNIKRALELSFGEYGVGLPGVVWGILQDYPDPTVFGLALTAGLVVFLYLHHVLRGRDGVLPRPRGALGLVVVGLLVFSGGYAIFLTNANIIFTPTGIANRGAIAGSIGVAICFVGAAAWISGVPRSRSLSRGFFCLALALLCASGFLITNTIAPFWVAASRQQQEVLADIRRQFPTLPTGTTFLLDGVCPYVGPAIIFESNWDLTGALQLVYRDPSLRAGVVGPSLRVRESGLSTQLYGSEARYPYGQLLVYHFGR